AGGRTFQVGAHEHELAVAEAVRDDGGGAVRVGREDFGGLGAEESRAAVVEDLARGERREPALLALVGEREAQVGPLGPGRDRRQRALGGPLEEAVAEVERLAFPREGLREQEAAVGDREAAAAALEEG